MTINPESFDSIFSSNENNFHSMSHSTKFAGQLQSRSWTSKRLNKSLYKKRDLLVMVQVNFSLLSRLVASWTKRSSCHIISRPCKRIWNVIPSWYHGSNFYSVFTLFDSIFALPCRQANFWIHIIACQFIIFPKEELIDVSNFWLIIYTISGYSDSELSQKMCESTDLNKVRGHLV